MSVATNIASWGNSEAVRIPKSVLRAIGLSAGDGVRIGTTARGSIELVPVKRDHRCVQPKRGVTFESLFGNSYPDPVDSGPAWPTEDMAGVELEAWS